MKRLLIFILLFASGLALLVKLQGGASEGPDWTKKPSEAGSLEDQLIGIPENPELPPGGDREAEQTPSALPPEPAAQSSPGVGINGRITDTHYPEGGGPAIYTFTAEAKTNADGAIDLFDVRLEYPAKGVLTATKGRASLVKEPGALAPSIQGDSVSLEDVEMKLEAGHPLAPMTLTGARLQGNLPQQTFIVEGSGDEDGERARPSVSSSRFHFEAAKLDLNGANQRLVITGDAIGIVFDQEGKELYRLTGHSIRIENTAALPADLDPKTTPAPFEIFIDGDAKLTMVGDPTATLSSNTLTLTGEHLPSGELDLSEVLVDGTGVLAFGASTFTGSSFDFDFDKDGEAGSITVDGTPSVRFDLAAHSESAKKSPPLELNSQGPLTVSLDKYGSFETTSVTTLSWAETALVAGGGIRGSLNPEATELSVEASGGVKLDGVDESGHLQFATESLLLDYTEKGDSPREVNFTTLGAATFSVDGAGVNLGSHMEGATGKSLRLSQGGDRWTIPEAHDIRLEVRDKTGELTARATNLTGFDPELKLLDAQGDVAFEYVRDGESGGGSGELVVMQGLDSLVIEGSGDTPAVFQSGGARVLAQRISREAAQLEAVGGVDARLETEDGLFAFTCNRLKVGGLPTQELAGEDGLGDDEINALVASGLSFSAEGDVVGSVALGKDVLGLDCDAIGVAQSLLETGQAEVVISATGVRSAKWQSTTTIEDKVEKKAWNLTAGILTATITERLTDSTADLAPTERAAVAEGFDGDFRLLAEGGVSMEESVSGFGGIGESLRLERTDGYFVRLDGGLERARVRGPLPGEDEASYLGTVLWLEATDSVLEAVGVDVAVMGLSFMDADASQPLQLRCDKLGGVPGTLQLDGQVRMTGATKDGTNLVLTSQHATFTDQLLKGPEPSDSDLPFQVSFLAHGDVLLRQGAEFELFGTDLIVEHGGSRVRVAGRPASVSYASICATSSWVEFNPILMAFECGRGRLSMDPALLAFLSEQEEDETPESKP